MIEETIRKVLKKFCSPARMENPRPALENIAVRDGKAIATDAYKIIEVPVLKDALGYQEGLYNPKTGEAATNHTKLDEYPQTDQLFDKLKEPESIVYIDPKFLLETAQAMAKLAKKKTRKQDREDLPMVKIELHGKNEMVVFTTETEEGETIRAAVMPIRHE